MNKTLLLLTLLTGLLAGCAGSTSTTGRGHGLSAGALYRKAESMVLAADTAAVPGASQRVIEDTEVITPPTVVATPSDTPAPPTVNQANQSSVSPFAGSQITNRSTYSEFVERWTVRRGSDLARYRVTFRPGGDIQVAPEN
jgi:hypothetical protein